MAKILVKNNSTNYGFIEETNPVVNTYGKLSKIGKWVSGSIDGDYVFLDNPLVGIRHKAFQGTFKYPSEKTIYAMHYTATQLDSLKEFFKNLPATDANGVAFDYSDEDAISVISKFISSDRIIDARYYNVNPHLNRTTLTYVGFSLSSIDPLYMFSHDKFLGNLKGLASGFPYSSRQLLSDFKKIEVTVIARQPSKNTAAIAGSTIIEFPKLQRLDPSYELTCPKIIPLKICHGDVFISIGDAGIFHGQPVISNIVTGNIFNTLAPPYGTPKYINLMGDYITIPPNKNLPIFIMPTFALSPPECRGIIVTVIRASQKIVAPSAKLINAPSFKKNTPTYLFKQSTNGKAFEIPVNWGTVNAGDSNERYYLIAVQDIYASSAVLQSLFGKSNFEDIPIDRTIE
jgi:hypothetical protein